MFRIYFLMHFKCFRDLTDNLVFQGRLVLSNGIYLTIFICLFYLQLTTLNWNLG